MLKASIKKHLLNFKRPGGTSRGVLSTKETWFLIIESEDSFGIGECGMFRGLSYDDTAYFESKLQWVADNINLGEQQLLRDLKDFPAIRIGVETAFRSFQSHDPFAIFPSEFITAKSPISINGLIWMGSKLEMKEQIKLKLQDGFTCLKMKIGAIDFDAELDLLKSIRKEYSPSEIALRVDANGAFSKDEALEKLKRLSTFDLHSIEQPIRQGQWEEMARLCEQTPIPIALDEELIGVSDPEKQEGLISSINPQFIILKPTLIGGFNASDHWIKLAEDREIGWWITSALESNVGLNAISQYTFLKNSKLPQGLGTGSLYSNNIKSSLTVKRGNLIYDHQKKWDISLINS